MTPAVARWGMICQYSAARVGALAANSVNLTRRSKLLWISITLRERTSSASTHPRWPSPLDDRLTAHCRLYNAALQERSDAWKMARRSITCAGQNRELTLVLQDDPDWAAEHRRLAVGTLKRVDDAFQAFLPPREGRRETTGFPRFKPRSRFRTIELYSGVDRFVQANAAGTKATIRIKGLPAMRLRLHRPLPEGQPMVIRITRTPRRVVASLVYAHVDPQPAEAAPERACRHRRRRGQAHHPFRWPHVDRREHEGLE